MSNVDLKPHIKRLGNNDYVMVSGRVLLAHEDNPDTLSVETSIETVTDEWVIVRATVTTRKGTFTGHAVSNLRTGSPQEKKTPVEVAETSAVGRALGFAGYAIEGGIASADEIDHGTQSAPQEPLQVQEPQATRGQVETILELVGTEPGKLETVLGYYQVPGVRHLTEKQAKQAIARLQRKTAAQEVEA